jgi:hypothetical protein
MMRTSAVKGLPRSSIPRALREVWLAFHQTELCQGLDAVFLFRADGMEVWCAIDDEKSYQKLVELVGPRKAEFQIDLYPTRMPEEKKSREEASDPPPSLSQNAELRAYLQDPFDAAAGRGAIPARAEEPVGEPGLQLKRRLLLFAEETVEWAKHLRRYAVDLPVLAWAGFDPAAAADTKPQAREVCARHAREIEKLAQKLTDNLSRAFPRPEKQARKPQTPERPQRASRSVSERAAQLSEASLDIALRVHRFIYPEKYTVSLADLREPGLLGALRDLGKMASEFQTLVSTDKKG